MAGNWSLDRAGISFPATGRKEQARKHYEKIPPVNVQAFSKRELCEDRRFSASWSHQ
jgi:hypothetical protein